MRDRKDIIVVIILLSHGIYIWRIIGDRADWYLDLDLVRHSSKAQIVLVPPVSIEDRSLLWMVVRSQTYYPEHILAYGSRKTRCSLVVGFGSFRTD